MTIVKEYIIPVKGHEINIRVEVPKELEVAEEFPFEDELILMVKDYLDLHLRRASLNASPPA